MRSALFALLFAIALGAAPAVAQGGPSGADEAGGRASEGGDAPAAAGAPVEALIRILEDDSARARLVEWLRSAAEGAAPAAAEGTAPAAAEGAAPAEAEAAAAEAPPPEEEEKGVARLAAEYSRTIGMQALAFVTTLGRMGTDLGDAILDPGELDLERLSRTVLNLMASIGVVFGSFLALRWLAEAAIRGIARRAEGRGWLARTMLLVPVALIDALSVVVAWAAGYGFSLFFVAPGTMSIYQTLFLNAFVLIEAIKVALRLCLMHRHRALRLVPLEDTDAHYWYFWLSRIVSLVGYGLMFAVPVINWEVSYRFGSALRTLLVLTAVLMGILLVLQSKARVRALLERRVKKGKTDTLGRFLAILASQWHRIAVVYLLAFFVVWLTHPRDALPFMLWATVHSVAAIVIGVIVTGLLARAIALGLHVPADVKRRLPLLEDRLNAFVPTVLKILRMVVLIGVLLAIADAWDLLEVLDWLFSEDGQGFLGTLLSVAVILMLGGLLYLAVASWVEFRLNPQVGRAPTAREITLLSLLRNAFTILLCVMLVMLVLSEIGVNIGPLIAGAGVFGLAISFGAQKFVQDVITGAFIQFENAMNTGDVVTLGGISGVVERLSIRSVSLRSLDGTLHLIPFSSVDSVSNYMKSFSYHVTEIGVAYRESIAEVKQAMRDAFDRLRADPDHRAAIIDDLEMHGVTAFADSSVQVRARIKTLPGSQWAVGRAYNEVIKEIFDERGIEIPFPHVTLYMGEDRKGAAPPLRVSFDDGPERTERRAASHGRVRNQRPDVEEARDDAGDE